MQSRESVLKDREHRRPDHPLQFTQSDPELGGEATQYSVFESYGRYQDDQTGPQFSTLRLEAMQAGTQQGAAETNSIRLMPGTIFTLQGHPVQARNDRWQVVTVSHRGEQPAALEEESSGGGTTFTNSLTFAPGNIDWRPNYRYKPLADGDEVATIVGPKGEELYVNELGWVRVHFHWNRYDPADEKASCWVPVSNQWAGDGFGSVTLPRIGQEVLISYLNGDIDRPVVSGRYYNGLNKPPYPLPDNKTRSVWRTKSHKAEGFNELSFEDEAGSEEIFLHAQKDLKALVNNDTHWDIRANQHSKIGGNSLSDIEGNQETRIKGELTLHTSGKKSELADGESHLQVGSAYVVKAGQEVSVEAGAKITLSAGSELTLKAGGSFIKLAPGAIFTSSSLLVGSGSAGSGQGVNLKMPGVVPLMAAPTLIQQGVLSSDAPYCEECEKCKEGGGAIDEAPVVQRAQSAKKQSTYTGNAKVVLITAYGDYLVEIGDHSALYIEISPQEKYLYDPGGSYRQGMRGSGGIFSAEEADLTTYVNYQKSISDRVVQTPIALSIEAANEVINKAIERGEPGFYSCARNVSEVLKAANYGIDSYRLPGLLHEFIEMTELKKKTEGINYASEY